MKYLLVDAFNLIFRSFYAIPLLTGGDEKMPVNAAIGFIKIVEKLKKTESPNAIAIFFDSAGPNYRKSLSSVYKANRKDTPQELLVQIPLIKELCTAFGYSIHECPGAEADDVIASAVKKYGTDANEVLIVSNDKDLAQCVSKSKNVYLMISNHNKIGDYTKLDETGVLKKFGVTPSQIIDYLALVGDSCDNIRGVDSIGPRTAARLLSEYGTIDLMFDNINCVTPKRVMEQLLMSGVIIQLNKKIISLDETACDVELFHGIQKNLDAIDALIRKFSLKSLSCYVESTQQNLNFL
ncbi:MAG: hypothetical protein LBB20_03810 [Puniceicoccales bacterium]|jgi:DNA polymerase-1|nr:hypothetical protein [Puniceicoccales bacterium]